MKGGNGNIINLFSAELFQFYVILTICLFEILTHLNTYKYNLLMQQFGTYIKIIPIEEKVTYLIVFIQ